jgi:tellurite resistance protein TehA-like permease
MQDLFESFLGNLPLSLTVPLIFCAFGVLVYLYSVLVYLARRRSDEED